MEEERQWLYQLKKSYPTCPYCHYEYNYDDMYDSYNNMWEDDSDLIEECPACGKKFWLKIATRYEYSTSNENDCGDTVEEYEKERKNR